MSIECALLCVVILSAFAPEVAASIYGSRAAWAYVFSGVETAALWAAVGSTTTSLAVRAVAAWGVFEGAQRPICRLAFPMDRPVKLPEGMNLCDAALGVDMSLVSVAAALFVAALVQEIQRANFR